MKSILLIEDNKNIRENTIEILELSNYKVFGADNGKSGMELALKEHPDLIICDIMMPVLDGYGVLHMLQKHDSTKDIPFIFLTAKTERSDFRKGMELGADDYISKPFSGTELLNAVEGRLKKREHPRRGLGDGAETMHGSKTDEQQTDALKLIIENRMVNRYKKKQVVFSEGHRPNCIFYVKKGKLKTFKIHEDGKELVIGLYGEGDFVGHIALLENTNYKETAESLEETELAVIPKEEFESLINNNLSVSKKFIQLLAKDITEKEAQLLGLAYNSLRKKVAEALLALYKKYHTHPTDGFSIDISRDNLATIAGTATESLIRTLGDFKAEKLVEINGSKISILDIKKLQMLLN